MEPAPRDGEMTGAEFKAAQNSLALSQQVLADLLNLQPGTVRDKGKGKWPVDEQYTHAVRLLMREADQVVAAIVATGATDPLVTYRNDQEYLAHSPEANRSDTWHLGICHRVAAQTGRRIIYARRADGGRPLDDYTPIPTVAATRELDEYVPTIKKWTKQRTQKA